MGRIEDLERDIVREVNREHDTTYKLKDLREWCSSEDVVRENLRADEGEIVLKCKVIGVFCAFAKKKTKK